MGIYDGSSCKPYMPIHSPQTYEQETLCFPL